MFRAPLQTQIPRIGNGFSNSLNIHHVEGIAPIVPFIKKNSCTYNYQNICMGGRTHNFIQFEAKRFAEELSEEESSKRIRNAVPKST